MKHYFANFIDDLKSTHGANLASVVLYGSAAAGDFIPHESDYNLLIALFEITPKELRNAHACMREWNRLGHPIPTYFTVDEIKHAGDVFPIEFHFMERARKVLYGFDVLADVEISDKYLRHQTEFELRSKLMKLRREYIHASTSTERLVNLMADSLTSFSAIFRAVLLLKGEEPAIIKEEIISQTVASLGIESEPFDRLFDIRENDSIESLTDLTANQLFAEYLQQIERVIVAVDKMGKS